jgi:hypothetical protein
VAICWLLNGYMPKWLRRAKSYIWGWMESRHELRKRIWCLHMQLCGGGGCIVDAVAHEAVWSKTRHRKHIENTTNQTERDTLHPPY